ncbi:MAG: ATP-dependent zinc metalloprotease FtsH [Candidatus Pacebacteria bacterium]|nr:ATP-dependent zinc metalloprotease FtsH [Candidatus Paceibacterota bacterium]MCF7862581.1 ATP-dependent zinc metalloprotease FtsH [Candidatus Paceibacterota bacterium]
MDFNILNKKGGKKGGKKNAGPGLSGSMASVILILMIITALYLFVANSSKKSEEIPVSDLAKAITAGEVQKIVVSGGDITVTYKNEEVKKAKKEVESSLSETLANYGVSAEALAGTTLEIKDQSGLGFWLLNILPFLLPIIFIIFIFWYLSRQVKGAGMQAFTFGQSKARITDPNDKNNKVTFKDVAGCKEAKEELKEIVDFLKSPKKFLEIGARIPKGVILTGAPGTGKCITGDSLVLTNKGLVEIKDIPKYFWVNPKDHTVKGAILPTFDVTRSRTTDQEASHWYDLGEQNTFKITLKQGVDLEGTPEHPVIVMDSKGDLVFKKLEEIKEGDNVAIKFGTEVYGVSREVSSDQAYIMGLLTGDGNLSHASRIGFTSVDEELVGSFKSYVSENYPDTNIGLAGDGITHLVTSWKMKKDLYEMGMSYLLSYDKAIPSSVLQAPKHVLIAFLQGLFDSDGYFHRYSFGYSTVSKKLSDQVFAILLNMGIVPKRRIKRHKDDSHLKDVYEITVSGVELEKFSKNVGFRLSRKQKEMNKYLSLHTKRNTNIDLFYDIHHIVHDTWKELSDRKLSNEWCSKLIHKVKTRKTISRNSLELFLDRCKKMGFHNENTEYLNSILEAKLFFSPVKEITNNKARVYDFTVPKTHSFISNGLISHNTMLARAVAGEASVPFFHLSGSEFVEMFVGVGASRVRDLFKMAKKSAPAIIFVDEIDAIGRTRGGGFGGGNDEREQTLNQILVEMDGFEPNEKIIVMAATNRPDVLDPALVRPGRFDRKVILDLPDRADREEILKIHSNSKPLAEDINLKVIAERTPGFSGADLYSLMNEGAILAARENRKKVFQFDLIRAIEKVMLGPERKSHLLSKKEKEITAYHEAGHALVASVLPFSDPVHKVSIIARGRAGGYTLKLPLEDRRLQSKREFLDDIAMSLGGYVAEKMVFGDVTTGPSSDLQMVNNVARAMVTRFGMSDAIGPIALVGSGGGSAWEGSRDKEYSEAVSAKVDDEISKIVDGGLKSAEKVLTENRKTLDAIAKKLIEVETLEQEEYEKILVAHGIELKKKDLPAVDIAG